MLATEQSDPGVETYLREELVRIRQELAGIRQELPDAFIPRREYEANRVALTERIADLEAWQTWAMRVIGSLILTAVIGAIFTGSILTS